MDSVSRDRSAERNPRRWVRAPGVGQRNPRQSKPRGKKGNGEDRMYEGRGYTWQPSVDYVAHVSHNLVG